MSDYEDHEVDEYNFKVLVVGEVGVGKTSIIQRYTQGHFCTSYKPTLGADFSLKIIQWDAHSNVHLQLWDVAGHERYGMMTRVYYKSAMAAFIVYDLSRPNTLDAVLKWHKDLMENVLTEDEKPIPIILLGNKCDLKGVGYDESYLNAFCDDHGLEGWFPISAKTNKNIDEAMTLIISVILSKQPSKERVRPGTPWYRACSPTPKSQSPVDISPLDINIKSQKEHTSCC